jgi:hypothetical protein
LAEELARQLEPDGSIIFRHAAEDRLELPSLKVVDQRTYGGMAIEILARK